MDHLNPALRDVSPSKDPHNAALTHDAAGAVCFDDFDASVAGEEDPGAAWDLLRLGTQAVVDVGTRTGAGERRGSPRLD